MESNASLPGHGSALPVNDVVQYFEHPPRSHLYVSSVSMGTDTESVLGAMNEEGAAKPNVDRAPKKENQNGGGALSKKALSPLLLTGLMYTFTIGGAYGFEETVMGGGPFLSILSIIVIPIIMALPSALVVAEMASSVPSNAGFLMWMNLAFHRSVYFLMCLLSLLLVFIDNALYPVLLSEYFCTSISCNKTTNVMLRFVLIVITYILNLLGIEAVGTTSVILTMITVLPFVLMFVGQEFSTKFYFNWPALAFIPKGIDWITFITTASWNLSGLEQAGAVAEEIQNPQKTILQALIPLIGLACITYMPSILVGASNKDGPLDLDEWETGFWSEVSYRVGGNPLKYITIAGSMFSAFGLTLSAICTTTSLMGGMAQTEVFPGYVGKWLSQRNKRFGSYHWSLTLNCALTALFSCLLDFGPLVKMDQFLYGIRVLGIFIAFFIFRHKYPLLQRPFRIPLEGWKLYAVFAIPTVSFGGLATVGMLMDVTICLSVFGGCCVFSLVYCFFFHKRDFKGRIVTVTSRREQ